MRNILLIFGLISAAFLAGKESYTEGKVGQALRGRSGIAMPERLTPERGGVEFFFRSDKSAGEQKEAMLVSFGTVGPGWWYIRLSKGMFTVFFRGEKGSDSIVVPADAVKPDVWHHLAVGWGKYKQKGFVRIYLDGKLLGYRQVALPEKFSAGKIGIGYNTGHWVAPDFPGLIDELVVYDAPPAPETVAARAADPVKNPPGPGMILRAALDGSNAVVSGSGSDAAEAKKLVRLSARRVKVKKYPDELDFSYRFEVPMPEEKRAGTLNDGNDDSAVNWRQRSISLVCELERSCEIAAVEIVAKKYTKWYILKELHLSLDDGSGEFGTPVIVKTYGVPPPKGAPDIDESCKKYIYTVPNPGKACRIRIKPVGDAYMSLGEIRIREKK